MSIAWSVLNILCVTLLGYISLLNPFLKLVFRWHRARNAEALAFVFLGIVAIAHISVSLVVGYIFSVKTAVIYSAALFLHWALVGYFGIQRFAGPLDQSANTRRFQLLHPLLLLLGMLSTAIALALFAAWYWAVIIVAAWYLYGYTCAELAIRRLVRTAGHERSLAIYAINEAQGRTGVRSFLSGSGDKYPFP